MYKDPYAWAKCTFISYASSLWLAERASCAWTFQTRVSCRASKMDSHIKHMLCCLPTHTHIRIIFFFPSCGGRVYRSLSMAGGARAAYLFRRCCWEIISFARSAVRKLARLRTVTKQAARIRSASASAAGSSTLLTLGTKQSCAVVNDMSRRRYRALLPRLCLIGACEYNIRCVQACTPERCLWYAEFHPRI